MNAIDLNRIQKNVLHIITKYPEAADDDALLMARYWQEIDGWSEYSDLYTNLGRVTRPETITRRRRELYNMGLITYSQESEKDRMEAFKNEQERPAAISWLDD